MLLLLRRVRPAQIFPEAVTIWNGQTDLGSTRINPENDDMSSLSFENLFPADSGSESDPNANPVPSIRSRKLPASWSDSISEALREMHVCSDASPWVLSGARRCVECFFALTALVFFLPLMAVAAILVRLSSPGPVFFRQKRMGRDGREFTLYKFRSMRPESGCGSCITVIGDSRITPIGAFLRRYKLDELPQFWNVLRGDMSLVGPRPKLPHHEGLHLACRPGITGVATLAFRREEEFLSGIPAQELEAFYELFVKPAKATLDLEYIRSATLASDTAILWRTASSCLFASRNSVAELAQIVARHAAERAAPASVPAASAADPRPRAAGLVSDL